MDFLSLKRSSSVRGQAFTEYLLLVSVIASLFLGVSLGLQRMGLSQKLQTLFQQSFAPAYQLGHIKAKSFEQGGPVYHPRATGGENFRIFYNPQP